MHIDDSSQWGKNTSVRIAVVQTRRHAAEIWDMQGEKRIDAVGHGCVWDRSQ